MRYRIGFLVAAIALMSLRAGWAQYGPMLGYGYGPGYAQAAAYNPNMAPTPMGSTEEGHDFSSSDYAGSCDSCDSCGCGGGAACGATCGCCGWNNRGLIYGDFLYLRARSAEVAYAVPINGPITGQPNPPPGIQVGRVGVLDPDNSAGFRAGATFFASECNSISAQYTYFHSNSNDSITINPNLQPGVILRSLVTHPGTFNAQTDWLDGRANGGVDYRLGDIDYRHLFYCNTTTYINWLAGVRYGELRQDFHARFSAIGTEDVRTQVNFYGTGPRFGIEGRKLLPNSQFFGFGRAYASFLGGEFKARYTENRSFDPVVVDTAWKASRVVSILDLEVGVGWRNECDNFRLYAGYLVSGWYNVLKTNEWIDAVQRNNFVNPNRSAPDSVMTFDGLMARAEVVW